MVIKRDEISTKEKLKHLFYISSGDLEKEKYFDMIVIFLKFPFLL